MLNIISPKSITLFLIMIADLSHSKFLEWVDHLPEFNASTSVLFPDPVNWIFANCAFSITRLPVLYKMGLFSSFSLDKIPIITVDFVCFADETSNMINELIIWPVSFLSSNRLKNPFNESIITKDFIFGKKYFCPICATAESGTCNVLD